MNIVWTPGVATENFAAGREGNPVSLVVDHWMGTPGLGAGALFDSALARFRSPRAVVSAHFLVGTDGRIAQVVSTDDTAYHAGDWDTNLRSIGIEHEANSTLVPSDALYAASAWLHRELARIYKLPLEVGRTVKGHRDIVPTACPGTLDLEHIVALANLEEEDVTLREDFEAYKKDTDATIETMKKTYNPLYHHIHLIDDPDKLKTSESLVPPVEGAKYAGDSADLTHREWRYPDGTIHEVVVTET